MYYGFTGFCKYFTSKYPGYTIYPVRLNGSAVETLFSQLKYATAGQLSAANYSTARAAILTRGSVSGKKTKIDAYRNTQLDIMKHPIQRKCYRRPHK